MQSHHLAGCTLISDKPLLQLASFALPEPVTPPTLPNGGWTVRANECQPTYRGPGWIGNRWREVVAWASPDGYHLTIEGVGAFSVGAEGRSVRLERTEPGATQASVVEVALGPGLILALALQDTWCLHAGAVTFGQGAVAFAGESGNGKSTLADYLGRDGAAGRHLLADDILPVGLELDGVHALPHFPQLKLPPESQPAVGQPERMPLRAIYLLSAPETGRAACEIRAVSPREAALALVRHTVAARLFDSDLLARHMAFCSTVAKRVPVRILSYPRQVAWLPRVRDALEADLGEFVPSP